MQRKKLTLAILAVLISSSCASVTLTTWTLKGGILVHDKQSMTAMQAEGYRCYSRDDDTLWRIDYKVQKDCCAAAQGVH